MTPEHLHRLIETRTAPMIVDVRTGSEYQSGHVPGAIHIPFPMMWRRHQEMKASLSDPIILYCEHGPRAWIGKFALWTMGYTNVAYLDGHMSGWKQKGLPIETPSNTTSK